MAECKYRIFRDFVKMPMHHFDQVLNGKRYPCVQFATRTHPVFSEWHLRFYRGRRKVVPREIDRWLTPLAIAVWFMDDGAADHWGVTFQTHSFEVEEVEPLDLVVCGTVAVNRTGIRVGKGGGYSDLVVNVVANVPSAPGPWTFDRISFGQASELVGGRFGEHGLRGDARVRADLRHAQLLRAATDKKNRSGAALHVAPRSGHDGGVQLTILPGRHRRSSRGRRRS